LCVSGTSVQGPLGTGQCVPGTNNISRQQVFTGGNVPTQANSTYYPPEQFTNLCVDLGKISIELSDLGDICMSDTQVII